MTTWKDRFIEALRSYSNLSADWNSYESEPPNEIAIKNAEQFLRELNNAPIRIAPLADEGVIICLSEHTNIEFYNTGEILVYIKPEEKKWKLKLY